MREPKFPLPDTKIYWKAIIKREFGVGTRIGKGNRLEIESPEGRSGSARQQGEDGHLPSIHPGKQ